MTKLQYSILIGLLFCFACRSTYKIAEKEAESYDMVADLPVDKEIMDLIEPYKEGVEEKMNIVIGYNKTQLVKEQPESTLGNFTADAILAVARKHYKNNIDFGLPNYGGLRIPYLNAGPITTGNMFELMPFDNSLVVVHIDGNTANQLFTHIAGAGGWPISQEVKMKIDTLNGKHQFLIHDKAIDPKQKYSFCVSDYVANGGDNCTFLKEQPRDELNIVFREALIEYVQDVTATGDSIDVKLEGRTEFVN